MGLRQLASRRVHLWSIATATTCAAVFAMAIPTPLSNIDDHELRIFANDFFPTLWRVWSNDLFGTGRFRPLYWILEGAFAVATGDSGTILHLGRAVFLLAAALLQIRLALRLGAGLAVSCAAALLVNWSYPGIDVWVPGGPSEAFAQPLALGCLYALAGAPTGGGAALAAALGLASCLAKETYAAWTGAALLGVALHGLAQGRAGWRSRVATIGALAQFLPASIGWLARAHRSDSYARYVLSSLSGSPLESAATLLLKSPVLTVLGLVGLVVILARLARTPAAAWDARDLLVGAGAIGTAAVTFGLGLLTSRYHLALVTALALAAVRATSGAVRERWRTRRLVAAAGLCVVVAAGGRAAMAGLWNKTRCASEQRFRSQLASAFRTHGAARLRWPPATVEQVLGAARHLRAEGVVGEMQIEPCTPPGTAIPTLLRDYLAPYAREITGPAPLLVATSCFEESAPRCEPGWLPRLERGWPAHFCGLAPVMARAARDQAVVIDPTPQPAPAVPAR